MKLTAAQARVLSDLGQFEFFARKSGRGEGEEYSLHKFRGVHGAATSLHDKGLIVLKYTYNALFGETRYSARLTDAGRAALAERGS